MRPIHVGDILHNNADVRLYVPFGPVSPEWTITETLDKIFPINLVHVTEIPIFGQNGLSSESRWTTLNFGIGDALLLEEICSEDVDDGF